MFRLGHIYSLFFNKEIENGFLLVDEPENSLFPDFLYDLVDIYLDIVRDKNTQIFMATHNPIIASQFEDYERVILRFDDEGFVQTSRGKSPIGDDPNDLLIHDFGVRNIMHSSGVKKWERFIELKVLIPLEQDKKRKQDLLTEYMELATKYHFPKHELLDKKP